MLIITILASIGLYVVVTIVYKRGKKDGIEDAIDYFLTEMEKREIDATELIVDGNMQILEKSKKTKMLQFFQRRKKAEIVTTAEDSF